MFATSVAMPSMFAVFQHRAVSAHSVAVIIIGGDSNSDALHPTGSAHAANASTIGQFPSNPIDA